MVKYLKDNRSSRGAIHLQFTIDDLGIGAKVRKMTTNAKLGAFGLVGSGFAINAGLFGKYLKSLHVFIRLLRFTFPNEH
jgi:hypothetical protein